jgi:hypothetical protein
VYLYCNQRVYNKRNHIKTPPNALPMYSKITFLFKLWPNIFINKNSHSALTFCLFPLPTLSFYTLNLNSIGCICWVLTFFYKVSKALKLHALVDNVITNGFRKKRFGDDRFRIITIL